jgi:hypothetical protein
MPGQKSIYETFLGGINRSFALRKARSGFLLVQVLAKERGSCLNCTVNVDFLRIKYMVLAKNQHMSILELIFIIKQPILILCKKATHVIKLGFALRFISTRAICLP